jgi:hypothetical protein
MSTLKTNNVQVGQSATATNNFTLYQPSTPDGTVRLGVGNSGATTADVASFNSSGVFAFNSGYGSSATAYGCRAWVNFNGTGTPAIRASGNVSSITDNGTGNYTVNFTTALPDVNYCVTGTASNNAAGLGTVFLTTTGSAFTTTQLVIGSFSVSGSAVDPNNVCVAIFR